MPTPSTVRSRSELEALAVHYHRIEFLFFWGHRAPKGGGVGKSCFSQWYSSPFTIDRRTYPTAEHFMMASKATLFGDAGMRDRILAAATPIEAKALGRNVAGFREDLWEMRRFGFVVEGNLAKFSQNGALRKFLLSTGDAVLVEASSYDRIWGIGLSETDPSARTPREWRGENLLGFALMEVRFQLAGAG